MAAATVVTTVGLQGSNYQSPDHSQLLERLNPSHDAVTPFPTRIDFQFANYKIPEPVDVPSPGALLRTLEFLKHKAPAGVLARVPTDQLPALVKLLEFVSVKFSEFSFSLPVDSGGDGVEVPGASHTSPPPELTAFAILLEFLQQHFPELRVLPPRVVPALVKVVDIPRAVIASLAPPGPAPTISGLAPTHVEVHESAATVTFKSGPVENAINGPVHTPAGGSPEASVNASIETSTNVSVMSSTNVPDQTPAGGSNATPGGSGDTPGNAGGDSLTGADGSLGGEGASTSGGEAPTSGGGGSTGDGSTGGDESSGGGG